MRHSTELASADVSARPPERATIVARAAPSTRMADGLFVALLALSCVPIWVVAHVPTQDGASHVETVSALVRLGRSSLLQREYLANFGLQPNWLTQLLYAGLLQVSSPLLAERLLLSGYALLLPLAFRSNLPRHAAGRWAALGVFPFVFSFAFHMGFWNFTYGLGLFLLVLGVWRAWSRRWTLGRESGFAALLVLTYFAHSVAISSALAAIAAQLGWHLLVGVLGTRGHRRRRRRMLRAILQRAVPTCLAALPATALLALFLVHQRASTPIRLSWFDYAKHLGTLYALVSFDLRELALSTPVALALALTVIVTVARRRRRLLRPADAWLGWAAVATALYFASPDAAIDGAQISDRLALLPWLAVALWIGSGAVSARDARRLGLAILVVFVAGTGWRIVKYRQLEAYLSDFASIAPHVPEGSVLLPLNFAPAGPRSGGRVDGRRLLSYRIEVARHVAGLVATERHGVNLGNSQANTRHAPLRWRPERNPFLLLDTKHIGLEEEPPCVELWTYTALAGPIDAVVVWGATAESAREACGAAVLRELATGWDRVFVSPHGTAQLYLRRGLADPAATTRP